MLTAPDTLRIVAQLSVACLAIGAVGSRICFARAEYFPRSAVARRAIEREAETRSHFALPDELLSERGLLLRRRGRRFQKLSIAAFVVLAILYLETHDLRVHLVTHQ